MATNYSAAPGTPQTSAKAKAAALVTAIITAISVALAAYFTGTDEIGTEGILSALGAGLVNGLLTGLAAFKTVNQATGRHAAPGV